MNKMKTQSAKSNVKERTLWLSYFGAVIVLILITL